MDSFTFIPPRKDLIKVDDSTVISYLREFPKIRKEIFATIQDKIHTELTERYSRFIALPVIDREVIQWCHFLLKQNQSWIYADKKLYIPQELIPTNIFSEENADILDVEYECKYVCYEDDRNSIINQQITSIKNYKNVVIELHSLTKSELYKVIVRSKLFSAKFEPVVNTNFMKATGVVKIVEIPIDIFETIFRNLIFQTGSETQSIATDLFNKFLADLAYLWWKKTGLS